jgi:BirA family biotin operon repressor/biotin-[acetyl-CoA-carboxylase] ligase
MKDLLTPTAVQQALHTRWIGRTYEYLPRVSSTNDLLKSRVVVGGADEPPAGTVLLADYQENGRGRMARRWQAPPGTSLLFSVLLRPQWPAERMALLPLLAGLAVAEGVEEAARLPVHLKWPNDLVAKVDCAWRKFSGVLLEAGFAGPDQPAYAILGIGVNVNIPADQLPDTSFPATSLMIAAGQALSRLDLLTAILGRMERLVEAVEQGWSPQAEWNERLIMRGEMVTVSRLGQEGDLAGIFEGTDEQGRLLLRDENGRGHIITAADVSLRPH